MKNKRALYITLAVLAAAVGALLFGLWLTLGAPCIIKGLTGIPCPACGMTRACLAALRFDFAAAFGYHPLWVLLPPTAVLLVVFKIKKRERAFFATLAVFAAAMLAVYAVRIFGA